MTDTNNRPVSPVNGQPLPIGKPFRTSEQAREAGKKGGKRSVAKKAMRKTLREELLVLLSESEEGKTAQKRMSTAILEQALKGNTKAFEIIRDTIGEKPVENLNIVSADFSALEDAFNSITSDSGAEKREG